MSGHQTDHNNFPGDNYSYIFDPAEFELTKSSNASQLTDQVTHAAEEKCKNGTSDLVSLDSECSSDIGIHQMENMVENPLKDGFSEYGSICYAASGTDQMLEKPFKYSESGYSVSGSSSVGIPGGIDAVEKSFSCELSDNSSTDLSDNEELMMPQMGNTMEETATDSICESDSITSESNDIIIPAIVDAVEKPMDCDISDSSATFRNNHTNTTLPQTEENHSRSDLNQTYKSDPQISNAAGKHSAGEIPSQSLKIPQIKSSVEKSSTGGILSQSAVPLCNIKIPKSSTTAKPFKCDLCEFKCSRASNLKVHRMTHTGEKLHKCESCDYSCIKSSNLIRHRRIHTGEKPLKCLLCDFTANCPSNLRNHQLTHIEWKPFKCELCDYSARRSEHLVF